MAVSSVILGSRERASVLECGSPLPLFHRISAAVFGTTAPPILSRLAQYGDGARALARFNAQSCGVRKTPGPPVFWTVKRSRVRDRALLAPPPCHCIVRASINMLQLLSPLPACCAVAQRRRTGDGRGEISPKQSRIAPMNQNAMFLPERGNRFPLSPGGEGRGEGGQLIQELTPASKTLCRPSLPQRVHGEGERWLNPKVGTRTCPPGKSDSRPHPFMLTLTHGK